MKIDGVEIPDEKLIEAGWTPPTEARKRWKAARGDKYWFLTVRRKSDFGAPEDISRHCAGNYYRTREEAEKARNKQLAYMRLQDALLEYNDGWEPDWGDDGQAKFAICFDCNHNKFGVALSQAVKAETSLYGTREACERLLEEHEDDLRIVWGLEL